MDDKNFFKKIEENEYYKGFNNYNADLIRESMDYLNKNKLFENNNIS